MDDVDKNQEKFNNDKALHSSVAIREMDKHGHQGAAIGKSDRIAFRNPSTWEANNVGTLQAAMRTATSNQPSVAQPLRWQALARRGGHDVSGLRAHRPSKPGARGWL